jgi:hypothetical protein
VQQHGSKSLITYADLDPALLAFVKCHITSCVKWDVLRSLSEDVGFWSELGQLARETHRPVDKVREALDDLSREGIVQKSGTAAEPLYRLSDGEPTTVVVTRLIATVTRSQELRRIVVAQILRAAVA